MLAGIQRLPPLPLLPPRPWTSPFRTMYNHTAMATSNPMRATYPSPRAFPPVRLLLGLTLLVMLGTPARAQTVSGTLTDRATGAPIPGAVVVLEDSVGNERLFGLSDENGRFALRHAAPGTHVLRIDRPGVESIWSPPIALGAGAATDLELPLPADSVDLRGLLTGGATACHARPDGGPIAATVWAEVRKALLAAAVTDQAGLYHYQVRGGTREVAAGAEPPEPEWVDAHPLGEVDHHWREAGFVRTVAGRRVYQPPVPPILLDPLFHERHCFRAVPDPVDAQRIGLGFRSTSEVPPGVDGTLWVDAATGLLLELEYDYRGQPAPAAGGGMRFDLLDDGGWIIRSWVDWVEDAARARTTRSGEIVAVRPVFDVNPGETLLAGVVFDSVRGRALAGAGVFLWGTDHQTETDSRGRFVFGRGVPPGEYEVSFFHESLDDWDVIPRRVSVLLPSGGETFVELATPSLPTLLARACGDEGAVVAGTVRDAGSDLPIPLAQVVVDWSTPGGGDERRLTRTDARGWYRVCGVPRNVGVAARAQVAEGEWSAATVAAADEDVVIHHLSVGVTGTVRVAGRLVNALTDEPVRGATVSLLGMERRAASDQEGHFVFEDLPPGFYEVGVLHPDHGAVSDTLTVRDVGEMEFELRVGGAERAIGDRDRFQLEPIVVTGAAVERSLTGFYRRRSQGFGGFLTKAEWEVWDPREVTEIIRRMPSFVVRPNPTYDQMIDGHLDSRRYRIDVTRQSSRSAIQICPPLVFLDGALVGNVRDFDVDQLMVIGLAAAEAYPSPANMPPIFNVNGAECGVIALWTER